MIRNSDALKVAITQPFIFFALILNYFLSSSTFSNEFYSEWVFWHIKMIISSRKKKNSKTAPESDVFHDYSLSLLFFLHSRNNEKKVYFDLFFGKRYSFPLSFVLFSSSLFLRQRSEFCPASPFFFAFTRFA